MKKSLIILVFILRHTLLSQVLFVNSGNSSIVLFSDYSENSNMYKISPNEDILSLEILGNKIFSVVASPKAEGVHRHYSNWKIRVQELKKNSCELILVKEIEVFSATKLYKNELNDRLLIETINNDVRYFELDKESLKLNGLTALKNEYNVLGWLGEDSLIILKKDSLLCFSIKYSKIGFIAYNPHLNGAHNVILTTRNKILFISNYNSPDSSFLYLLEQSNITKLFTFGRFNSNYFLKDSTLLLVHYKIRERILKWPVNETVPERKMNSLVNSPTLTKIDFNGSVLDEIDLGEKLLIESIGATISVDGDSIIENIYFYIGAIFPSPQTGVYKLNYRTFKNPELIMNSNFGMPARHFKVMLIK